jgi:hypothetical protein
MRFNTEGKGKKSEEIVCRLYRSRRKSGGGPPQSKTLARLMTRLFRAKRFGLRQSSGAFGILKSLPNLPL